MVGLQDPMVSIVKRLAAYKGRDQLTFVRYNKKILKKEVDGEQRAMGWNLYP